MIIQQNIIWHSFTTCIVNHLRIASTATPAVISYCSLIADYTVIFTSHSNTFIKVTDTLAFMVPFVPVWTLAAVILQVHYICNCIITISSTH